MKRHHADRTEFLRESEDIGNAYLRGDLPESDMREQMNACFRKHIAVFPGGENGTASHNPIHQEIGGHVSFLINTKKAL